MCSGVLNEVYESDDVVFHRNDFDGNAIDIYFVSDAMHGFLDSPPFDA
jgi:hypothetical protein